MAKNINVKLALKDQFTGPLQKATKNTKSMDRHLKRTSRSIKRFGANAKAAFKKTAKYAAVGAGAIGASMAVYAKNSIEAAKVQIEQETKLQAVLMNTKGMRVEQIEGLKKYAGQLQAVGVVGDEVALAGVQQLGSYQLQADTIKKLMPGMQDLLVQQKGLNATTGDSVQIGNMVGKVMAGQVGALSRAGINFSKAQEQVLKFGNEQQKAAVLADVLKQNVGGVNKAMAQTDQGKIQSMANAWGDVSEEVGKMLLPILGKLAGWFSGHIPKIQSTILKTMDKVGAAFTQIKPYILEAKKLLGRVAEDAMPAISVFKDVSIKTFKTVGKAVVTLAKNWDRLSPIIYTVVGAMTAYNVVTKGYALYTTAAVVAAKVKASWDAFGAGKLTVLTAAQYAYNFALKANPIGLVITAIGGLVGAGVMLYKNWDLVTEKCKSLWTWVKDLWASLDNNPITRVAKSFLTFINPIGQVISAFGKLRGAWDTIKGAWDTINPFSSSDKEETAPAPSQSKKTKRAPRHALGTSYFQGGRTGINEGGRGETAILPSGTKVLSHEEGKKQEGKQGAPINVKVIIQGNVIGNDEFMERCGEYTGRKVLAALANM